MPNFNEIREQLGGDNEPPFFVIHQGPLIVALCLREDFNPNINSDSPEVWIGANFREWGDRLANDPRPVPLYVAPTEGGDFKFKGIYEVTQQQPTPDHFNAVMTQAPYGLSRIVYLSGPMKNPIVKLVENELAWFSEVRAGHPGLFPPQDNLYPIPFFGDIRRADVLTLALNPAWTEFREERYWLPTTQAPAVAPTLASRLLHYFDLPVPEQHQWFDNCQKALLYIGCSYERNAAHIDVHPLPTNFVRDLGHQDAEALRVIIDNRSASHLLEVLKLVDRVKLVLVVDYAVPLLHGGGAPTFDFLSNRLTMVAGRIVQNGSMPPILRCPGHRDIANWVFARRKVLREYLRNAPPLDFHD
jgi:hypothetical protein